jgi:hypothetical protein
MKRLLLSNLIIFCSIAIYSQSIYSKEWMLTISSGIEAHDKRLFDYSEKEALLEMQPEFWGTYHYGLDIQRKIWRKNRLSVFLGTGISFEKATFDRPFNHLHFEKDNFFILRALDTYKKAQIPLSISTLWELKERLFLKGDIISNLVYSKSIENSASDPAVFPYIEKNLNFDGICLDLGVVYLVNKFWVGIKSRMINYQMIDKIIFNSLIRDPRVDQKWEWSNPLHLDFTIGYMW